MPTEESIGIRVAHKVIPEQKLNAPFHGFVCVCVNRREGMPRRRWAYPFPLFLLCQGKSWDTVNGHMHCGRDCGYLRLSKPYSQDRIMGCVGGKEAKRSTNVDCEKCDTREFTMITGV